MQKAIFVSLLFFSTLTTAQTSHIYQGTLLDFGKPEKRIINYCKKDVKIDSRISLKLDNGETLKIYVNSERFNKATFVESVYPLIRQGKYPYIEVQILECEEKGKEQPANSKLIATKITLVRSE